MVPQLDKNSSLLSHLKLVAEATYTSTVGGMSSLDFDGANWNTGTVKKPATRSDVMLTQPR